MASTDPDRLKLFPFAALFFDRSSSWPFFLSQLFSFFSWLNTDLGLDANLNVLLETILLSP